MINKGYRKINFRQRHQGKLWGGGIILNFDGFFTCSNGGNGILGKGNIIPKGTEVEKSGKVKVCQISMCDSSMDWL